jgi:mannose-6-phosphate isomerase-like protein (cupin superfamily)
MSEGVGYVVSADRTPMRPGPGENTTFRVPIDRSVGCQNLEQRVFRYGTGRSVEMLNPESEDVLYVVEGRGQIAIDGVIYDLAPTVGVLVPPGARYMISNPGPGDLLLVSVLSPQPGQPPPGPPELEVAPLGVLTVAEAEQETLPAGDRWFKLLVDPRMGCRNVTQFVGFIPPGRAPFHTHTYEEVVYIVEGEGIVHIGTGDFPIRAGSSIYLPPLLEHCLENTGATPLRVLGVFCPAGDPSSKASEGPKE